MVAERPGESGPLVTSEENAMALTARDVFDETDCVTTKPRGVNQMTTLRLNETKLSHRAMPRAEQLLLHASIVAVALAVVLATLLA